MSISAVVSNNLPGQVFSPQSTQLSQRTEFQKLAEAFQSGIGSAAASVSPDASGNQSVHGGAQTGPAHATPLRPAHHHRPHPGTLHRPLPVLQDGTGQSVFDVEAGSGQSINLTV